MKAFIREIKGSDRQKTITIPKDSEGKLGESVVVFSLETIIDVVMELKRGNGDKEKVIKELSIWESEE